MCGTVIQISQSIARRLYLQHNGTQSQWKRCLHNAHWELKHRGFPCEILLNHSDDGSKIVFQKSSKGFYWELWTYKGGENRLQAAIRFDIPFHWLMKEPPWMR